MMSDMFKQAPELDDPWFAPKRYGLGAGLPIAWQGWAVLALYAAVVAADSLLIRRSIVAYVAILAAATVTLLIVCANKTRGGWRWRWGGRDRD
jgi:hypothetical protein